MLRGEPDPVRSAPSVESAFDKSVAAVVQDDELDNIFREPVTPAAPAEEEKEEEKASEPPAQAQEEAVGEEVQKEEEFKWEEADVLLHADDHNAPVKCTYRSLVYQVQQNWAQRFRKRTVDAWYQAVRRWCKRNRLSLRKPTRTTRTNPKVKKHIHFTQLAPSIRKFREEVRVAVAEGNVKPEQIANLDETAVKPFADMVRTLHFLGQRSVPGRLDDKRAKLYMSIVVVWWADGRMDFVVVWKSDAKTLPPWEKFGKGEGVHQCFSKS